MSTRRTERIGRDYFEDLYTAKPDPWGFDTSDYERRKYDATLAAIGEGHQNALEIGCSIGVFTQRLAPRCRHLLAVDIAETALDAARRRCADLTNVEFRRLQLPDERPEGRFDLVVLSEVGYYWTRPDLDRFLAWLRDALTPGGRFVLVHWTGATDYPLTGDQVHDHIASATRDYLRLVERIAAERYRLDVLVNQATLRSKDSVPTASA
jgi:cyclopropane fatty-acyl-phospholipid synthase-like methyltransferase